MCRTLPRNPHLPNPSSDMNSYVSPWMDQDLTKLKEYCEVVSRATSVPIPPNYPVVGEDAFRTATGVHAAAVIK